jgi:Cellulose binding domain/Glycosyl hydrolase family 12/Fibronectin type III domain
MIWINHQGSIQPFGSDVATATIDGASYQVWTGRQSSWNIVSYVAVNPVASVSNLNLFPFFTDAVSRGSLETTWWLIDVEYGFEIWTGGQGLAMTGYSVSAAAGSGGGSCATVPSAPSGLTATTASSSTINLSWTADTAPANCTISSYNVFRSTTSGFTPSSSNQVASGITATSYSSTGLSASTPYYYKIEAVDAAGTSAASAQASATTSASGSGGAACTIDYTISNQWQGGFGAAITIDNTGATALTSWTLTWAFANGQTVTDLWNGTETQSGAKVTVTNLSYNGSIPAGGSYSAMGFNGTWNNTTNAIPTAFSLNGTPCTVN